MTGQICRTLLRSKVTRILFVSANESAPWGASEELWSQTAIRLAVSGWDVTASVRGWEHEAPQLSELEHSGCTVLRRWQKPLFHYRPIYELPESERTESTLARVRPDLVVVSQGDNYEGLG